MPSLFPTLFPSELPSGPPYTGPAISRLPTQVTPKEPTDKTILGTSSTPGFILSETPNTMPNTSPPEPCIVPTSFHYEKPNGSPSTCLTPSRFT